jgi:DNA-binding response OmpR family regulator
MKSDFPDSYIMIVDDNEFHRNLLAASLNKKNFTTLAVESGEVCLESMAIRKPDLVLLDIMLPKLNGNQVLQTIREKFNAVDLPIIMITGRNDVSDTVESLKFGANDYISKPINLEITLMRIQTQLTISKLSQKMAKLKEMQAIHAMIATYNHELNNPLAAALANLTAFLRSEDKKKLLGLEASLWRIADIVKAIEEITKNENVEFATYSQSSRMVSLKKP